MSECIRQHYYCDDCWYTCPKHPEGCCDESKGNECNCGTDEYNKKINDFVDRIKKNEIS
jgi:hypothetical protein